MAFNPALRGRQVANDTKKDFLNRTILYDTHVALGARMAPFGGYDMPIQYTGIIREHRAAREAAAIFDTCHMGEFRITGEGAATDLEAVLSCPVASIRTGRCRYGFITNETGGVIDDQILYRMGEKEFFMVVNASTEPNDFAWLCAHLSAATQIKNLSAETAKLDLQGPGSPEIMRRLMELPIDGMNYYTWAKNRYRGREVLLSRTGYTGEIGFEIYSPNDCCRAIWDECLALGAMPAGLGCRDTLRLEMGLPLYGHELDEKTNAAESGLRRSIAVDKKFIGSSAILDPAQTRRLLVGIALEGRRAARHGDRIHDAAGREKGVITSGSFSPSLGYAIALGYVALDASAPGTALTILADRQELAGRVTGVPFYKRATGRADLRNFL